MSEPRTLQLLTYTYVDDMAARRTPHRGGHLELIQEYLEDGRMVIAGAAGDPPTRGLLAFATASDASAFAAADPYGEAGLVASQTIEPWVVVAGL